MSHLLHQTLESPITQITVHTSGQTTSNSANTLVTIDGSEYTYTPAQNSTHVVYEISFYAERKTGIQFNTLYLQEYTSGSWSEIDSRYNRSIGNGGFTSDQRWYYHIRFIIPSWSGARALRLAVASNSSSKSFTAHAVTDWDGSSSSTTFCNTNLFIYSV